MVDRFRAAVTVAVVVMVGLYVIEKLAHRVPNAEPRDPYVNARGVITAATAIAKSSEIMGKLRRNATGLRSPEREG